MIPPMIAYRERSTTSPESHPSRRVRARVRTMATMNANSRKTPNEETGNKPNGVGSWKSTGLIQSPPAPANERRGDQRACPHDDRGVGQIEYRPHVHVDIVDDVAEAEAVEDVPERSAHDQAEPPLPRPSRRPCRSIVEEDGKHGQGDGHRGPGRKARQEPKGDAAIVDQREREQVRDQDPRPSHGNEARHLGRPGQAAGKPQDPRGAGGPGTRRQRTATRCRSSRSLHLMHSRVYGITRRRLPSIGFRHPTQIPKVPLLTRSRASSTISSIPCTLLEMASSFSRSKVSVATSTRSSSYPATSAMGFSSVLT